MLKPEFKRLNEAVKSAGAIIMSYFGKQLQLTHKSTSADYRTQADVEAEQAIIGAIEEIFPGYNIVGEEHGAIHKESAYTFIIDPLDGTNNFVLGIPAFSSCAALLKGTEIIYGVIYHPVTGDTYFASKGKGAFLNGSPISVNAEHRETNCTVSYYCDYTTPRDRIIRFKTALLNLPIKRLLDLWSPTLCYCGLASGRTEALINDGIEWYDYAAGKLIAMEAGAKVTDFWGKNTVEDADDTFLITNGTQIHDFLIDQVTRPIVGVCSS